MGGRHLVKLNHSVDFAGQCYKIAAYSYNEAACIDSLDNIHYFLNGNWNLLPGIANSISMGTGREIMITDR